jgi:hypothetical protein
MSGFASLTPTYALRGEGRGASQVAVNRSSIRKTDVSGFRSFLYSPTKRARRPRSRSG